MSLIPRVEAAGSISRRQRRLPGVLTAFPGVPAISLPRLSPRPPESHRVCLKGLMRRTVMGSGRAEPREVKVLLPASTQTPVFRKSPTPLARYMQMPATATKLLILIIFS